MPFTLAHPVAAVPLRRYLGRFGDTTALAVGAVMPDLAYFIPGSFDRSLSHSLAGLILFCMPAGLLTTLAFETLFAPLLIDLAPHRLAARLPSAWSNVRVRVRDFPAVSVSIVIGAATHLAWDSFTHANGSAVQLIPALRTTLWSGGGYTLYAFKVLQHGSSALGIGVLVLWCSALLRRPQQRSTRTAMSTWLRVALVAAILLPAIGMGFAAGRATLGVTNGALAGLREFMGGAIFMGGQTLLLSLLVVGLMGRLRDARSSRSASAIRQGAEPPP